MQEPITFRITSTVIDGEGQVVSEDTIQRMNLSYENLVAIQDKILQAGIQVAMGLQNLAKSPVPVSVTDEFVNKASDPRAGGQRSTRR